MGQAVQYFERQGWFTKSGKLTADGEEAFERIMASIRVYCPKCESRQYPWDDNDYICTACRYGQ